jgi:predicted nucleic acid-binding protein
MVFYIPDLLVIELKRPSADHLTRVGLVVYTLTGEQLIEIVELRGTYSALSLPDIATFVMAQALSIGLLTGERRLRELAQVAGIEVHGTLWLLGELLRHGFINHAQACAALQAMLHAGRRLPKTEVSNLRLRWGCE